jgi:selenide,water dikinase
LSPAGLAQVLGVLDQPKNSNLIVGFAGADDAAVYRLDDDRAIVVTTDFFPPMVDDPYSFGMVAAANALSDVYAMGGRPLVALNIVGFPAKMLPLSVLSEILQGGADKVRESGAVIGGGHTVEDHEVKYGLAVTGEVHPDKVWANGSIRVDDAVILTKPLGTGLINSGVKVDSVTGKSVDEAIRWMSTLNGLGISHLHEADVSCVTDITGFGLLGHAAELAAGSPGTIVIDDKSVPTIVGLEDFFQDRYRTRGARETREYTAGAVEVPASMSDWRNEVLFDPQTSGGLLITVRQEQADDLVKKLQDSGLEFTAVVGSVHKEETPGVKVRVKSDD